MNYFPHYTSFKNVLENLSALIKFLKVDTNSDRYFQFSIWKDQKEGRKKGRKFVFNLTSIKWNWNLTESNPSSSECQRISGVEWQTSFQRMCCCRLCNSICIHILIIIQHRRKITILWLTHSTYSTFKLQYALLNK